MSGRQRVTASRRSALAALGTGVAAVSGGCLRRARSLTGWQSTEPVELQIKTLPTDSDPYALAISREIADWLRAAGIAVDVLPMDEQELLRQCLLRTEFELFVMRLPARFRDPDALHTLFHSRYADEPGWQNPFGYANIEVDEALERQRRTTGEERLETLSQVQQTIATTQPFTLLTVPDDIRAANTETYSNWGAVDLRSPLGYLRLDAAESDDARLRIVGTDRRPTINLNPLSVEFRRNGVLTGLLYDPLTRAVDGELTPWLAESIAFSDDERPTARVRIREGVSWHDDEPLTAEDVAFTYDLLADTTMDEGDDETEVPSPEFRGRSSLVSDVSVVNDEVLELTFVETSRPIAERAMTVPILPQHVWSDRTGSASIGGISVGSVTEALVSNNIPPVGSGPFEYVDNTPREQLQLERNTDHFSTRSDANFPEWIAEPTFDELSVQVVGSNVTAVETVSESDADVTGTPVGASTVPRIGRADNTELLVGRSDRPYVLGYNIRRSHLDNPRFRNTLARLIDERYLGDEVLGGYARAEVGPLAGTEWYPEALEWAHDEENPVVPFIGTDGELNPAVAREAFREAGYQYDDGTLLGGSA